MKTRFPIARLGIEVGGLVVVTSGLILALEWILASQPATSRYAAYFALIVMAALVAAWRVRATSFKYATDAKFRFALVVTLSVFLSGVLISALGTWELHHQEMSIQSERFGRMTDRVKDEVQQRVNSFSYGLRGARGPFIVKDAVSRADFRAYVASRDLAREFRGARGFGYVQRVRRDDLGSFLAETRADGAPNFQVQSAGDQEYLYIIKYIEPVETNLPALGLDFAVDPPRRAALEHSMLSGEATITSKVKLLMDEANRSGCVCFLPVYRKDSPQNTPEARRASLQGWVYAPLVLSEALAGALDAAEDQLDIEIFDGSQAVMDSLVFSNAHTLAASENAPAALAGKNRLFQQTSVIAVSGRAWTIWIGTRPQFEATAISAAPIIFGGGGILVSALLAIVVWSLGTGRARALALANGMIAEVRASEAQARDAVRRMEQSERDYRGLFEHAHDAIVVFTPEDEVVVEVNERACELYGFSREEFIGMSLREISEDSERGQRQIKDTLRTGSMLNFESFQYRKDGSIMPVEINAAVLRYRGQRVIVSINRDVTWRKHAEAQLFKAAHRDVLTTIAGGIAHEFNSMLTTANIFLRLPDPKEESQEPPLAKVSKIIQQAQTMSASLLELFAGSEHEEIPLLQLNDWLPERLQYLSGLLPARVRIQFDQSDVPLGVRAEPLALEQILRIILANAADALPDGGCIQVSVGKGEKIKDKPTLEIRIADQGHGVPEADRERLFEPFFTSRTRSRRSGLGLAIAARLVEQLGGTLKFEPNSPRGSVFVIRLLSAQGELHELEAGNRG